MFLKREIRQLFYYISLNTIFFLFLGNIALHIFSADAREEYDLESLWAIGSQYDRESNKQQQSLVDLFAEHSLLNELSNENNINSTK